MTTTDCPAAAAAASKAAEMPAADNDTDNSRKRPLSDSIEASAGEVLASDQGTPVQVHASSSSSPQQPPTKQAKKEKQQQKPEKLTRNKKTDPQVLEVRRLVQNCCRTDDLHTAITAYDEAVSKGIKVEAQTFYNLLNLCDGLSDRRLRPFSPVLTTGG